MGELDGLSLDRLDIDIDYEPDPSLLSAAADEAPVEETLVSHLLRRTARSPASPTGAACRSTTSARRSITRAALHHLVSQPQRFHEQCVERIFRHPAGVQAAEARGVCAYTRRGGLDINPFRTNYNQPMPDNARTARQ
jgi:7-cyano-7-deazaguanine reductase